MSSIAIQGDRTDTPTATFSTVSVPSHTQTLLVTATEDCVVYVKERGKFSLNQPTYDSTAPQMEITNTSPYIVRLPFDSGDEFFKREACCGGEMTIKIRLYKGDSLYQYNTLTNAISTKICVVK